MRKIYFIILTFFCAFSSFAQNCNLSITATPTTSSLCAGQTTLTANNVPLTDSVFVQWHRNNVPISGANGISFSPTEAGIYKATSVVTATNGKWSWQNPKPQGDRLNDVFFVNASNGWAVANNGSFLKTTDGGTTWNIGNSPSPINFPIYSICMFDSYIGWLGMNSTIYKTTNGGITWTEKYLPQMSNVNSIYFINANKGWAVGASGKIIATSDGGETWEDQISGTTNVLNDIFFTDFNNGWAVGKYGTILKTNNGGTTWSSLTSGISTELNAVQFVSTSVGFATGQSGVILKTNDGGNTWSSQITNAYHGFFDISFSDSNTGWIVGWYGKIYKTVNAGVTWTEQIQTASKHSYAVKFINNSIGWAVGEGGAIIKTIDGGITWTKQSQGTIENINDVHFLNTANAWCVGDNGTVLKTNNGGEVWTSQNLSTTNSLYDIHFVDVINGWVVGQNGTIRNTSNGGNTWNQQNSNVPNGWESLKGVHFTTNNNGWAVGDNGVIVRTTNGGTTWTIQASGTTNSLNKVFFSNSTTGWIVGDNGTILNTTNGGASWNTQTSGITTDILNVFFLDANTGWACGRAGKVLKTINGGISWISQTLPATSLLSKIQFINANYGWVVGAVGDLFITNDGGVTWRSDYLTKPTNNNHFNSFFLSDANNAWIVGDYGTILKWTKATSCESNTITVNPLPAAPTISGNPNGVVCSGTSVQLTASNCVGNITWNTGATTNTISVPPTVTTNYTAVCSIAGCSSPPAVYITQIGSNSNYIGKVWDKRFGGSDIEANTSIIPSSDGGFVLSGYSNTLDVSGDKTQSSQGMSDIWVLKIDANGNKVWDKRFGGNSSDGAYASLNTYDGGYLIGGFSVSGISGDKTQPLIGGGNDYWIVKIDGNGNKLWDQTFGGTDYDVLRDMINTPDGGYLLGGSSRSNISGNKTQNTQGSNDYWIIKLDSYGNKVWDKRFGGNLSDDLYKLSNTSDGGYILAGTSLSNVSGDKTEISQGGIDYWIVKIDGNGNKIWDKTLGGSGVDYLFDVINISDGNFLLGGRSDSGISGSKSQTSKGSSDYWVLKIDNNGNKIWDKSYGGDAFDNLFSINLLNDGSFVLFGSSISSISGDKTEASKGNYDYWIVKIDGDGNKIWDKTYGGSLNESSGQLLHSINNEFLLSGNSDSGISGDKSQSTQGQTDYWVLKVWLPTPPTLTASLTTLCNGQTSTLTATDCPGTVTWNTGATGSTLTISPSSTTSYTANCSHAGQVSCQSAPITITVCQSGSPSTFGYSQGNFSATDGGAAIYSMPITLPAGSAGVKPELGISYNSQGGNGILGVGWSLDGLHAINRSSKTRAQDEAFDVTRNSAIGVSLSKEDRFALDGARLVLAPNSIEANEVLNSNYGRKGTEYITEQNQFYRVTIPDTLANGAPKYFEAYTKDGLIMQFGNSLESRIDSKDGVPITWLVNKISDRNGNYIKFNYQKETAGIANAIYPYGKTNTYPISIEYTANDAAALTPYNRIEFEYTTRSDKQWSFMNGSYIGGGDKLLSKIKVLGNNVEVRRYEMTYIQSKFTANSLLYQVQECANTLCHEPTTFNWLNEDKLPTDLTYKLTNTTDGPFPPDAYSDNSATSKRIRIFGDWDGDGTNDLCIIDTTSSIKKFAYYLNRYPTTQASAQTYQAIFDLKKFQFRTVDLNADGRSDILFWNSTTGESYTILSGYSNGNLSWLLQTGSTFVKSNNWVNNPDPFDKTFFKDTEVFITDINKDGLTDLVSFKKNGKNYAKGTDKWVLNGPPKYIINPNIGSIEMWNQNISLPNNPYTKDYNRIQIEDFNNDGLSDVCILDTATSYIGFFKMLSSKISDNVFDADSSKYRIQAPTYALTFGPASTQAIKEYAWNNALNKFTNFTGLTTNFYDRQFFAMDANGDGLPDIATKMSETSYQFQLSTGNFELFEDIYTIGAAEVPLGTGLTADLVDFNNDGNVDLLTYTKNSYIGSAVKLSGFDKPTLSYRNPLDNSLLNDASVNFFFGHYSKSNLNELLFYKVNGQNLINKIYNNNLSKSDLIGKINEGSGQEIEVIYKTLKDPTVYARSGIQFKYPLYEFVAPISVVATLKSKDGIGGYVYTDYQYEGAFAHTAGRGFRGFTKVIQKDRQRNIYNVKYFTIDANKWWLAGQPYKTETRKDDPTNGQLLSLYEATTAAIPYTRSTSFNATPSYMNARGYYSYGKNSSSKTYDFGTTSQIGITTSRVTQDQYGNATTVVVDHGNGVRDSTVSQYTDNVSNWIIGRLSRSTAYRFSPSKSTQIRTVAFEYNATTGQLTKQITDPDSSIQIKTETIYSHDVYGNIIQTESKAWNGSQVESRISNFVYDGKGRFKLNSTNPLGMQTSATFNQNTGSIITNTDMNGLVDTYEHDAFQRIIKITSATGEETQERIYRASATYNSPVNAKFVMWKKQVNAPPVIEHYDILGRVIRVDKVNFAGNTISYTTTFNNKGEVVSEIGPGVNKAYQYDVLGRVTRSTDFGEDNTYEYVGNQTTVTDIKGRKRIAEKNSQGQLINARFQSSNGTIANHGLTYEYDGGNNPTRVVGNTNGFDIKNFYDARGNKIRTEDPVMGVYKYEYNGFGELLKQTDPKNNVVLMEYDKVGRVKKRTEPEGVTTYTYDVGNKAKGKVSSIAGFDNISYSYTYDNFGRTATETKTINGTNYVTSTTYTTDNKLDQVTYPSGLVVKHEYNAQDYLYLVRRVSDGKVMWRAKTTNSTDNILTEDVFEKGTGQNAVLRHSYTYATDLTHPTQLQTFLPTDVTTARIQKGITYDNAYSITANSETLYNNAGQILRNGTTNYQYDDLDRLTSITPNISFPQSNQTETTPVTMTYDLYGNILTKSDVGTYIYDQNTQGGPRYLTRVDVINSGVCIPSFQIATDYTSFNKVKKVSNDSSYALIYYGPDHQRVMQKLFVNNQLTKTKIYVNSLYEVEITGNQTRENSYIRGSSGVVAVETKVGTTRSIQLWVKDNSNNLVAVVDTNGNVLEHLRYDVWGRRLNAITPGVAADTARHLSDRGFTKHEHLDLFQLINMNGRIYDPVIARFISPDPFVSDVMSLQAYNRYAYVGNNPINFTDPSGYWGLKKIFRAVSRAINSVAKVASKVVEYAAYPALKPLYLSATTFAKVMDSKFMPEFIRDNWRAVVTTAVVAVVGAVATTITGGNTIAGGAAAGFAGGFLGSSFNGGSYSDAVKAGTKGAIIGALSGALGAGVSSFASGVGGVGQVAINTVGQGVVQGTMAEVQGGNFWDGAKAGAAGAAIGGAMGLTGTRPEGNSFEAITARTTIAAATGGTVSVLGGGKFANGAMSGAFAELSNTGIKSHQQQSIQQPQNLIDSETLKNWTPFKNGVMVANHAVIIGLAAAYWAFKIAGPLLIEEVKQALDWNNNNNGDNNNDNKNNRSNEK